MRAQNRAAYARRLNRLSISIAALLICAAAPLLAQDKEATSAKGEGTICPNDEPSEPDHFAVSLTTEFDSRYIFRGVNSLPGSGIATFDTQFDYKHFSLQIWDARGISKSFHEMDFYVSYSYDELEPFTFSGGYINYYTPDDDHLHLGYSDTQEVFVSIDYDIGSRYTATLKYNYDFDKIRGGFIEPKFAACFPFFGNKLAFDPYVSITYDLQYNSNRFVWNNFQAGIEIVRKINETLKLSATFEVSVPLAAFDQFAKKVGWVGVGFTADF